MSNMKCPVCGKDIVFIESDEGFDVFVCTNSKCQCSGYANESVWKYIDRTRKALDVAVDALKYANKCIKGGCVNWETEIDRALNKITAILENNNGNC